MKTITINEIKNKTIRDMAQPGDVVATHRFGVNDEKLDWCIDDTPGFWLACFGDDHATSVPENEIIIATKFLITE